MLACSTVKEGKACVFMKKKGCTFNGGQCHSVVESCQGCAKIENFTSGDFCQIFAEPAIKWIAGSCNMATHAKNDKEEVSTKKLNPLKASKRSRN